MEGALDRKPARKCSGFREQFYRGQHNVIEWFTNAADDPGITCLKSPSLARRKQFARMTRYGAVTFPAFTSVCVCVCVCVCERRTSIDHWFPSL
jgi:hypothetical protein